MSATQAFTEVGKAVYQTQIFEQILLMAFEARRMITESQYRELTQGMIDPKKFKNPIANLIRQLAESRDIDPNLKVRIEELIQKRHTLIHRFVLSNGLGGRDNPAYWNQLKDLASDVTLESSSLTKTIAQYMLDADELAGIEELPSNEYFEAIRNMFVNLERGV